MNLPSGLAARFQLVREIPAQGAEASVLVVEDLDEHGTRVLKLYRRGIELHRDALEMIRHLSQSPEGRPHIVTLHDFGTEAGHWWELLEYCPRQSLRDVMRVDRVDPRALAAELATALAFTEGRLFMRDLKPENLLVRELDPLDVVMADFGLARSAEAGSVRLTEGGTMAYMPPEAGIYKVTASWDWWSAGMVLAELSLDRHPLADDAGQLPPMLQIPSLLSAGPVDISGIHDERIRLLCSGLLVRDPDRRWRRQEVLRWAAGESPEVPPEQVTTVAGPPEASFAFGGVTFDNPAKLAKAFQARWSFAFAQLFQDRDPAFIAELDEFLRAHRRNGAAQILAKGTLAASDLPARMALFLLELDPDLTPEFDGLRVTPAGLAEAAQQVVSGNRSGPAVQLRQIREWGILNLWSSLPGMSETDPKSADIDRTWQRECRELDRLAALLPSKAEPPEEALDRAKARLLLCALDHRQLRDLRREVRRRRKPRHAVAWWRELADQGRTSTAAAALGWITRRVAELEAAEKASSDADAATRAEPVVARGLLVREARAVGLRPGWIATALALVLGLLWTVVHFQDRIVFFIAGTTPPGEDRYPITVENVETIVDNARWFVAVAAAYAVALVSGIRLRGQPLRSGVARLFVVVSALVELAGAAALALLGAAAIMLGYIAVAAEDNGFPPDYVPEACKALLGVPAVIAVCLYVAWRALIRLVRAVFGGEVIVR